MSIKSDNWIRRMAREQAIIEPFEAEQVREINGRRIISYGTSSYGYDVRCANEFKIFTNINSTIVDPKAFDEKSFVDFNGEVCIIPPNSFALARTVEYFRIPRSVLTVCLGKSTYARCFSADTRVALVDGSSASLEEMAARSAGGELFWGYSLGAHGRIIVSLLDSPRCVGRDSLIELMLDSGEAIRATSDHMFFRRDGRMVAAGELRPGDSMMPLYRAIIRGCEGVYQPVNGDMTATDRLADEWNLKHEIYEHGQDMHRHHIDFNRRNNKPTNIRRMAAAEHVRRRNDDSHGTDFDAARHAAAIGAALKRLPSEPEWRQRFSLVQPERAADFWRDGRFAALTERLIERRRYPSEQTREAHRQATVSHFQDEMAVLRHSASIFPQVTSSLQGTPGRNHKIVSVRELPGCHDVYCLTVPEAGNFALEAGVFVKNCGIIVNVTPLEPEWEGHVTLEFSNTTPLPARIYANEGVAQMLFFESDEVCSTSYRDRGGKYMKQRGVTLPKT